LRPSDSETEGKRRAKATNHGENEEEKNRVGRQLLNLESTSTSSFVLFGCLLLITFHGRGHRRMNHVIQILLLLILSFKGMKQMYTAAPDEKEYSNQKKTGATTDTDGHAPDSTWQLMAITAT
jgi:hypothetical protein